jgi:flagellin
MPEKNFTEDYTMALTINTNISSLNAQRNLSSTQGQLSKSMERLSSGLRINSAADDAAGLAMSVTMNANIKSMNQAVRNANDGVSMTQTAEGSLNETTNILTRMRELAMQSSTGTVTDRTAIQGEFDQLSSELDRIAAGTSSGSVDFQVGTGSGGGSNVITLTTTTATMTSLTGGPAIIVSTQASAQAALATLDAALTSVSTIRGTLGAVQNRLQSTINNLQVGVENSSAALSRIRDVDVAAETANMTRANILVQAGVSILAQANASPQSALKLLQ